MLCPIVNFLIVKKIFFYLEFKSIKCYLCCKNEYQQILGDRKIKLLAISQLKSTPLKKFHGRNEDLLGRPLENMRHPKYALVF